MPLSASTATPRPLTSAPARPRTPLVLVATVADDVIVLATRDGGVAVQVPLDDPSASCASGHDVPPVSVVCALDAALARRLHRRVTAWRRDEQGRLSAGVRPSA